jgi:hypothetical protein
VNIGVSGFRTYVLGFIEINPQAAGKLEAGS